MDCLSIGIKNFERVCQDEKYIIGGISVYRIQSHKPDAFIVKMTGNKIWIKSLNKCQQTRYWRALDTLLGVFFQTIPEKIRKNIYFLIIENSCQKGNSNLYAINPDLTVKDIKVLFYESKDFRVRLSIKGYLKTNRLNKYQVEYLVNMDDINKENIINFFVKRGIRDKKFREIVFSIPKLKTKYLQKTL